jgi:hypothetical protein
MSEEIDAILHRLRLVEEQIVLLKKPKGYLFICRECGSTFNREVTACLMCQDGKFKEV